MNPWFMVLMAIMLNVNGLGDKDKWLQLWKSTPRVDIICFQETHLRTLLEFAFQLNAQGYDFYFSHGTSALAGVCTAICHTLGVDVVKLTGVPGYCLPLDLTKNGETVHVFNIYAPNNRKLQTNFFMDIEQYITDNVMLLGDFNSVISPTDRASHHLDHISALLSSFVKKYHLVEPSGSHLEQFTYHHPSIFDQKSHLDRIYINFDMTRLWGFSNHVSFSDHYLVGLYLLRPVDMGPHLW